MNKMAIHHHLFEKANVLICFKRIHDLGVLSS